MEVSRRNFIIATSTSSTTLLTGCTSFEDIEPESGDSSPQDTHQVPLDTPQSSLPEPEVLELLHPVRQFISSNQIDENTFTVTIQNTGYSGNIIIGLFWEGENSEKADSVRSNLTINALYKDSEKHLYFNSGERRTIEFIGFPDDSIFDPRGYYFLAQPTTYGATIRNNGVAGRITATIDYIDVYSEDVEDQQTVYIGRNGSKDVLFNDTLIKPETQWTVTTSI